MQQAVTTAETMRAAVAQGDYAGAVDAAAALAPEMAPQLVQFRFMMERYAEARQASDWRRALRALADARMAAIAAGLPELETLATNLLYDVVKQYEGRRP